MRVTFIYLLFLWLSLFLLVSCSNTNTNITNDSLWQKFLENEIINLRFNATNINYHSYFILGKKETIINLELKNNLSKKNSIKLEYELISATINNVEVNEKNKTIEGIINMLCSNNNNRKSLFSGDNIKTKIYKTNKTKNINGYKCVGYNFINKILPNDGNKKCKEIGTIWIDLVSGKNIEYGYEGKISLFDTNFIPVKMHIKNITKYQNSKIEEIINESEINANILFFMKSYNKIRIIYSNFTD